MPSQLENIIWYTVDEFATIIGTAFSTAGNKLKNGEVPFTYFKNTRVVTHETIVNYLLAANFPPDVIERVIEFRLSQKEDQSLASKTPNHTTPCKKNEKNLAAA